MTVYAFEASGKIKKPSAAELAEADENAAILAYSHGTADNGKPYYAFVAVRPSKYKEFYALSAAKKKIKLSDYGVVLASGYKASPPASVVKKMKEKYGFDENFKENMMEDVKKQHKAFGIKQEEKRLDDIVAMLKKKQNPNGSGAKK